jgi:hypothetical protein
MTHFEKDWTLCGSCEDGVMDKECGKTLGKGGSSFFLQPLEGAQSMNVLTLALIPMK